MYALFYGNRFNKKRGWERNGVGKVWVVFGSVAEFTVKIWQVLLKNN